jgi:hypothetical protein
MFRPPVPSNSSTSQPTTNSYFRLGLRAERCNHEDPNTANLTLRQLTATNTTARVGLYARRPKGEGQASDEQSLIGDRRWQVA